MGQTASCVVLLFIFFNGFPDFGIYPTLRENIPGRTFSSLETFRRQLEASTTAVLKEAFARDGRWVAFDLIVPRPKRDLRFRVTFHIRVRRD